MSEYGMYLLLLLFLLHIGDSQYDKVGLLVRYLSIQSLSIQVGTSAACLI